LIFHEKYGIIILREKDYRMKNCMLIIIIENYSSYFKFIVEEVEKIIRTRMKTSIIIRLY